MMDNLKKMLEDLNSRTIRARKKLEELEANEKIKELHAEDEEFEILQKPTVLKKTMVYDSPEKAKEVAGNFEADYVEQIVSQVMR